MQEAKHTAGPWTIGDHSLSAVFAGKRLVASCGGFSSSENQEAVQAENEANARLIAAAPELLRVTEIIQQAYADGPVNTFHTRVRDIAGGDFAGILMAALDKAKAA